MLIGQIEGHNIRKEIRHKIMDQNNDRIKKKEIEKRKKEILENITKETLAILDIRLERKRKQRCFKLLRIYKLQP